MRICSCLMILVATQAFAGTIATIPLTTNITDTDPTGLAYDFQSDGKPYVNNVDAVTTFLTSNGYNHIQYGDWQFGTLNSTTRLVSISFANPAPLTIGGTHNPPFTINKVTAHIEDKCTQIFNDMLTMSIQQTFQCPLITHFFDSNGAEYRIYMGPNWEPETTYVQVTCNAVASDGCKDWYIDPISPAGAIGRLVYFAKRGGGNEGDYYFKFHFHLTRP
ncbi:MAG TPA: hypothetical protein VFV92_00430 [Candidatus Bathyarchaeia archaeon]|nr:hypothetical protein [Candidatus Bathyarchaeia archaeon]